MGLDDSSPKSAEIYLYMSMNNFRRRKAQQSSPLIIEQTARIKMNFFPFLSGRRVLSNSPPARTREEKVGENPDVPNTPPAQRDRTPNRDLREWDPRAERRFEDLINRQRDLQEAGGAAAAIQLERDVQRLNRLYLRMHARGNGLEGDDEDDSEVELQHRTRVLTGVDSRSGEIEAGRLAREAGEDRLLDEQMHGDTAEWAARLQALNREILGIDEYGNQVDEFGGWIPYDNGEEDDEQIIERSPTPPARWTQRLNRVLLGIDDNADLYDHFIDSDDERDDPETEPDEKQDDDDEDDDEDEDEDDDDPNIECLCCRDPPDDRDDCGAHGQRYIEQAVDEARAAFGEELRTHLNGILRRIVAQEVHAQTGQQLDRRNGDTGGDAQGKLSHNRKRPSPDDLQPESRPKKQQRSNPTVGGLRRLSETTPASANANLNGIAIERELLKIFHRNLDPGIGRIVPALLEADQAAGFDDLNHDNILQNLHKYWDPALEETASKITRALLNRCAKLGGGQRNVALAKPEVRQKLNGILKTLRAAAAWVTGDEHLDNGVRPASPVPEARRSPRSHIRRALEDLGTDIISGRELGEGGGAFERQANGQDRHPAVQRAVRDTVERIRAFNAGIEDGNGAGGYQRDGNAGQNLPAGDGDDQVPDASSQAGNPSNKSPPPAQRCGIRQCPGTNSRAGPGIHACNGGCEKTAHMKCIKRVYGRSRKTWQCPDCERQRAHQYQSAQPETQTPSKRMRRKTLVSQANNRTGTWHAQTAGSMRRRRTGGDYEEAQVDRGAPRDKRRLKSLGKLPRYTLPKGWA
jgi:hypothetical protein